MKLSKINFNGLMLFLILALAMALPFGLRAEESEYASCNSLNDFISYSKCVAEIDAKKSGQTSVVVDDIKSVDGDFSLVIGEGSGQTSSIDVVLHLKASADTTKVAISKDSNFGFADRLDFSEKKLWRLDDSTGETQYVYVKFFDKDDNVLKTLTGSVVYNYKKVDEASETEAKKQFSKIYNKTLNSQLKFDNSWLQIAAYGLSQDAPRDLDKEKTALAKFVATYKSNPKTSQDWSLVHAMAYASEDGSVTVANSSSSSSLSESPFADSASSSNSSTACVMKPIKQILDVGSKGDEVKAVQTVLKCAGYLDEATEISGVFDVKLETAVKKFQEKYKLACAGGVYCGRLGPATRQKLLEIYKEGSTQATPVASNTQTTASSVASTIKLKLSRNLTLGLQGTDVEDLQKYLAQDSAIYPEAKITGLFGPLTEEAVKRFQTKYKLSCNDGTACGYVGPATRTKLQEVSAE